MRYPWFLLVLFLCTFSMNVNAAEPAGIVATVPVVTWTYRSGEGIQGTGALMVPNVIDVAGSLTLVVRANAATTLIRMSRGDAPDSVQFLFGSADALYIHVPRRGGWTPETTETLQALISYDKNTTQPRSRMLRLVDAKGDPLHGFNLRVSLPLQFFQYSQDPKITFPIAEDGTVTLPIVASPVPRVTYPFMISNPTVYILHLRDSRTSQSYEVSIPETDRTDLTTVMLPVIDGDAPAGVNLLEGEILDSAGSRTNGVNLSFGSSRPIMQGVKYDPTTITAKMLSPAPDGTFRIAVSDDFRSRYESSEGLDLRAWEPNQGLFKSTSQFLPWGHGRQIKLPKRLDLVGSLVGKDGKPIILSDRIEEGNYPNFSFAQIDAKGKHLQQDSMGINVKETTGPLFNLPGVPVLGRYIVTAFDEEYGPVEVGETSPTAALEFQPVNEDGRRIGVVQDETSKPLAGALVLLLSERPSKTGYTDVAALIKQLQTVGKEDGMEMLNAITSGTVEFVITGDDGAYAFSRNIGRDNNNYPYLLAVAPDRFPAYLQDTTSKREIMPSMDVTLPEVHLPGKARATGVVNPPPMVPDNDHLGKLKPLSSGNHKYRVYMWSTRWFAPSRYSSPGWQYETESAEFSFRKPFLYDIPVGTSYSLAARPVDYQLYLNMYLWQQGPAAAGETVELAPATLRALQPFHLKVVYADDSPAAGLPISALYNTSRLNINGRIREAVTDANGEYLLYGDEDKAPEITVSKYQPMHTSERFKIQHLDMSTSVPTLTLRLDPKIWGTDGKGSQ